MISESGLIGLQIEIFIVYSVLQCLQATSLNEQLSKVAVFRSFQKE